jgi:dsDNA-specific endonuclease/ATPase MutS2
VQDNINAILAKFQVTVSELTSYATNIVRDWEKDKEEIERLKALNEIQQKVISNQQTKINEMRNQLVRTNEKLQAVKLSEMKSEAIKQKISELDSLASEIAHPFDPSMNLLETF